MLYNDLMHPKLPKSDQNNATKQFIAVVVGESSINEDEAAAIGSVMMNRLKAKKASLSDGFIKKIGGAGQFDAIGGKQYNEIMRSSWDEILSFDNEYATRISGAIRSLSGTDSKSDSFSIFKTDKIWGNMPN